MRTRPVRVVGLMIIVALATGILCAPASAKKRLTHQQRVRISAQLKREVKKNPKVVRSRSFLKRASLVNFRLPVTIRLRTGDDPNTPNVDESGTRNPNNATIDLGTSLGRREVDLGGALSAEIVFADSYDGGALGNVSIELLPSATKTLTTTSIPLVWDESVFTDSTTRWDGNAVNDLINKGRQVVKPGCGDFDSSTTDLTKSIAGNLIFGRGYEPVVGGPGLPGYPLNIASDANDPAKAKFDADNPNVPEGFLENQSGIDTPSRLRAAKNPGDPMSLGGNPMPFPYSSSSTPGGFSQPPSVADTLLRTAPLSLRIATPGTQINNTGVPAMGGDPDGVNGSENQVIGKSGGQANLFGRIPGKSYGIDVTASFATKISSILRILDQDLPQRNLIEGETWPAGVFGCRQIYTGYVDNQVPDVHLRGDLRISPATTYDGKLRIAKATVSTLRPSRFPVSACVVPLASFQEPNTLPGENRSDAPSGSYTEYDDNLPSPFSGNVLAPLDPLLYPLYVGQFVGHSELPVDVEHARAQPPNRTCNSAADRIVRMSSIPPMTVDSFPEAAQNDGSFTTGSGATISVGADLDVQRVELDIILGDVDAPPVHGPDTPIGSVLDVVQGILNSVPTVTVPPVTVPSVTVPAVTTPTVTTPPVTVPPVTVPEITTPIVTTPTVTTPPVTVPPVTVPPITTPTVTTPTVTTPEITTPTVTVPTVPVTVPTVTVPSVTTPDVTTTVPPVTTPEVTIPVVTTTIPSVTTTTPTVPGPPPVTVPTVPTVTTTVPTVTTTVPTVPVTVPTVTTTLPVTVPTVTLPHFPFAGTAETDPQLPRPPLAATYVAIPEALAPVTDPFGAI